MRAGKGWRLNEPWSLLRRKAWLHKPWCLLGGKLRARETGLHEPWRLLGCKAWLHEARLGKPRCLRLDKARACKALPALELRRGCEARPVEALRSCKARAVKALTAWKSLALKRRCGAGSTRRAGHNPLSGKEALLAER